MKFIRKNRFIIAILLVLVLGAFLLFGYKALHPLPKDTVFRTQYYTFTYPRIFDAKEYAPDVVSLGHKNGDSFDPLVEVVRYQSDPDESLPANYLAFIKRQAAALCGADGPIESVSCSEIGITDATTTNGDSAKKLDLTLVKKNIKTGTTTSETFGPFYVFNTTLTPNSDFPLRYSAVFINPSLFAFLNGTSSPELMDKVVATFKLNSPASTIGE